jgi:hemin uptake protein HemP
MNPAYTTMNDSPASPPLVPQSEPPRETEPRLETPTPAPTRDSWRSDELLGARDEVFILHNNDVYRLRRTRQGKLILYK